MSKDLIIENLEQANESIDIILDRFTQVIVPDFLLTIKREYYY